MEIVFEILFMILIDGCFEIISNKEINILIRKTVLGIVTLVYVALIICFTIFIIKIDNIAIKIFLMLVATFVLVFLIKLWVKVYKNKAIQ